LGESGAGKTTTLLELSRDLINRAEQSLDYRIPVIFNLSSWAIKKQPIGYWIVEELSSKYQVPTSIGGDWVEKQELLLLLDGLDEVKAEHRESCVAALNDFHQNYAPEMVVCSRTKDYKQLSNHLNFQSTVYLNPLTREQIHHYLHSINRDLTGLRVLIKGNTALQKLAKLPLMLNIMVLAYEGVAAEDLPQSEALEEQQQQLFDAYIERMLHRPTHGKVEQRYSEAQTKRWLVWLAQSMIEQSQTVFFIEAIQPIWLRSKGKRILCLLGIFLMSWLISWPIGGLICSLSFGVSDGLIEGLILGLGFGLIHGLCCGLISVYSFKGEMREIKGNLKWYWKEATNGRRRLIFSSIVGVGLICGLYSSSIVELVVGLIILLSYVVNIALIDGGGKICIQHFTLRLILYMGGYIPWNYARFLDYATECNFLQKVGGGYIFIHHLLLEHFAQMELETSKK
jgi:hypothetical protein